MKAMVKFKPMQLGDIKKTYADIKKAQDNAWTIIHLKILKVD